ncbi:M14 family metallopeptidase [uncultured Thiodictyon sp.]|uniref:M14 family metallopeptidase n=1 Tax=uncultured Thiodictyon sp. TaxID=1846217 RepID=UPI0025F143F8|nr:M14 family metallopeptidase [uncultured Thiodictyon sp.]
MLQELDHLPAGLLEADSRDLCRHLGGPTLIHLPGARQPPLFVCVLLHGNEPVGWDAVRGLLTARLARFGELRLPRALSLFIGNVTAAAQGVRHLPDQPDYNRVWPGGALPPMPETALMAAVLGRMTERGVFASIDLHNNTGTNPHYACVERLDSRTLQLATLFARTVVYFSGASGVQSNAFADLCPAVTLECGKVGEAAGVTHARALVDAALHLAAVPDHPVAPHDIDLFHTVARVLVPSGVSLGFPPQPADLLLDPEIERYNFREVPRGTAFARPRDPAVGIGFEVLNERGKDIADRFFHLEDGEVRLRRPVMPAMLTRDLTVIRQDCLGYLMERYSDHVPGRG